MTGSQIDTIIVDDEDKGRETLKNLLAKFCADQVRVIGQASSVQQALTLIRLHNPELVFLDIEMPQEDGFRLIERAAGLDFEVVFTTAFDQYAVRAFKYSVLDYLLKPVNVDGLIAAVTKAQKVIKEKQGRAHTGTIGKLALPTLEGYEMVDINDIIRCEASVNYTTFYFKSRPKMVISRPLKEVEQALAPYDFLRVHKHHLVNLRHILRYIKGKGGLIALSDNSHVDVSWRNKNELIERLGKLA